MALTIKTLAEGIEEVNLAFIEHPEFGPDEYPPMVVQYLMGALLIALGYAANDFGFYTDPAIGYTGYIRLDNQVLFFAPTKAVVMDRAPEGGELSPFGELP